MPVLLFAARIREYCIILAFGKQEPPFLKSTLRESKYKTQPPRTPWMHGAVLLYI